MRSLLSLCIALGLAFAIAGCAKPPQEELDAANSALSAAKSAEADVYAPDTYRSAQNALNDANSKVEAKDYEGAKVSAGQAKQLAERAANEARTNKSQITNEAQAIINRVSPGISDTRSSLGGAPRGKGADDDLDQLNADLSQAESDLSSARSNLNSGKVKDALSLAKNAEAKFSQVQGSVSSAMQKIEAWKEQNKPWFQRM